MDGFGVALPPERRARLGAARAAVEGLRAVPTASSPQALSVAASVSPRRLRLGVMGGTFDPIHHGHLVAASEVASLFSLDEVVFVPTGQPWQKSDRTVTPPEDRYLMTVIATASNPRFSVSRVDIDRGTPTYTVDTLRDLRLERGPEVDFFFITGADALGQIFSWRDADELVEMAHFVGCTRPGHTLTDPGLPLGKASLVEIPALAISSTACRERVRRGEPVWYLVPDGIVQYINKRALYQPLAEEAL
jgi:nicotinate-nucleotide adenylyltransferase